MVELIPRSYLQPLDLCEVFGRQAVLEVDVGCGDGALLAERAARHPARDFLGFERLSGRVQSACRKAERRHLTNVRVLRIESSYAVRYLLPQAAAATVHLYFPDPWPKARHQRRRIVTDEFVADVHRALAPGGLFRIATDDSDYFGAIAHICRTPEWVVEPVPGEMGAPVTTFERHFKTRGAAIYRLELRKVSPLVKDCASQPFR